MKNLKFKHWLLIFVAIFVIFLMAPVAAVQAQGPGPGDQFVFGSSFTLSSGQTLDGDLVVMGGAVTLQRDSTVKGDVAVFGGRVNVEGTIEGDIAVIGGSLQLGPNAKVEGDAVSLGGSISRDPDSIVEGDIESGAKPDRGNGFFDGFDNFTDQPSRGGFGNWIIRYFLGGFSAIAWAAILAALGVLLIVLIPRPTERVATTASLNPLITFGVGFVTVVLSVPVILILSITICLIPLAFAIGAAVTIALIFGWIAVGWYIGKRLLVALKAKNPTPILEVVVGVIALTVAWKLPAVVPCVGWLVSWTILFIVGSIGIGAVILSRAGTRTYYGANGTKASTNDALPEVSSVPIPDEETPAE